MNYIRELNAFRDWLMLNPLTTSGVALWYTLMSINNMAGWSEWFAVPNSTLQQLAKLSKQGLADARNELKQKRLIDYKPGNRKQAGSYKMNSLVNRLVNSLDQTLVPMLDKTVDQTVDQMVYQSADQTLEHINKHKHKRNETKQDNIPYAEIVGYLNEKTGSSYKPTTKATQSHIKARWREGFRLDDFKVVIDNMVEKWGNDPKMSQYLRPETLFGTKFESYLNTKRPATVSTTSRLPLVTLTPEQAAEMERIANAQRRA